MSHNLIAKRKKKKLKKKKNFYLIVERKLENFILSNKKKRKVEMESKVLYNETSMEDSPTEKEKRQQMFVVGSNYNNLLTVGGEEDYVKEPKRITHKFVEDVVQVAASLKHVVALTSEGVVYTWGSNESSELGRMEMLSKPNIVEAMSIFRVTQIACAENLTAMVTSEGKVFCMGSNKYGEAGQASVEVETVSKPKMVREINEPVVQVACGKNFTLALTLLGSLYGWGNGSIGNGDALGSRKAVLIQKLYGSPLISIECGSDHTLALTKSGQVYSWGKVSFTISFQQQPHTPHNHFHNLKFSFQ